MLCIVKILLVVQWDSILTSKERVRVRVPSGSRISAAKINNKNTILVASMTAPGFNKHLKRQVQLFDRGETRSVSRLWLSG